MTEWCLKRPGKRGAGCRAEVVKLGMQIFLLAELCGREEAKEPCQIGLDLVLFLAILTSSGGCTGVSRVVSWKDVTTVSWCFPKRNAEARASDGRNRWTWLAWAEGHKTRRFFGVPKAGLRGSVQLPPNTPFKCLKAAEELLEIWVWLWLPGSLTIGRFPIVWVTSFCLPVPQKGPAA